MIRSVLSVSAGLAVIAVLFAALWIGYGPRPQGGPDRRAAGAIPLSQQGRTPVDTKGQAIRTIAPGSASGPGMAATTPPISSPSATAPANRSADLGSPAPASDGMSTTGLRPEIAPGSTQDSAVSPGGTVDLNSASVEQLNGLGAGMIGKRIIEFRPYTAPEDLLTRRVLKRADYDTIRNAITVR